MTHLLSRLVGGVPPLAIAAALEKKSADVLRLLSEVRSEFDQNEASVETVRRRLEQTRESLDQMDVRTRKLQKALRNLDQQ